MTIPKIIHKIWFQGEKNIPIKLKEYHNTWVEKHQDYQINLWDEITITRLINKTSSDIINIYNNYDLMIQKIDFAKYVILYYYGGIYIDMDVKCFKSLNILDFGYDMILSTMPYDTVQQTMLKYTNLLRTSNFIINNGIMMSKKHHPVLKYIIKEAKIQNSSYTRNIHSSTYIFISTGPVGVTNAVYDYLSDQRIKSNNNDLSLRDLDINLLDNTYFEACTVYDIDECKVPDNAIGLHVYNLSWASVTDIHIITLYKYAYKYSAVLIILLIIIILYFNNKYVKR